ncbi:hypothetical protein E4U55_008098 [Claviceps digitariae]|nr:hypothetical protein E4U55_008098 [Claviceps digitariae]
MHFSTHRLYKALPLLLLFSTVSGNSRILVDPITEDNDYTGGLSHHSGPDTPDSGSNIHVASFRKEIVHTNKASRRRTRRDVPETKILGQDDSNKVPGKGHEKGHDDEHDTHLSLINATPYRWHLTYNSSYQLTQWDHEWPTYVMPGESVTVRANNHGHGIKASQDSAGEVTYELEQTKQPASFQVQYRSGQRHDVWVQFRDQLKTLNNEVGSQLDLGFSRTPGGVGFVLAGKEGDFLSNNGPVQWMQSQLPEIGHLPLREILLPRSHNSGMWVSNVPIGVGQSRNTLTQSQSLYHQLHEGGIRVLDYRPLLLGKRFHAAHGALIGHEYHGMVGASLADMIADFNNFTQQYPGELFIWDIHEGDARNGDHHFKPLTDQDLQLLYQELQTIQWRASVPDHKDITHRPLNSFISPKGREMGQSSVLIRVPTSWARRRGFPGPKHGFVSGTSLPLTSRWSNTNHLNNLVVDQLKRLYEARSSRKSHMHNMDWVLTLSDLQAAFPVASITDMSRGAWRALYGRLWRALSDTTYPNMLSLDDIHGSSLKAMAMTVNKCLAGRRCGALGGKVTVPKRAEDVDKQGGEGW